MKNRLAYQVCYVIAAVAAFGASADAAGIATVTDVVNDGYRTPPGREEQAAKRADELVPEEALRTDEESMIHVQFVDGSQLSVEEESEIVLTNYVFDGSAAKGLINLNDGLFHFTSNGSPDQGVKLRTPVATIGVRGTEFLVHVDDDDATIIDIISGAVEAQPNGSGKSIVCIGGQSILVAGPDEDAICGDLGSFSTASGTGPDRSPEPGHGGQNRGKGNFGERRDPPADPGEGGDDGGGDDGGSSGGGNGNGGGNGSGAMLLLDDEPFELG